MQVVWILYDMFEEDKNKKLFLDAQWIWRQVMFMIDISTF